jgi:hypothetical protein
MPGMLLQVHPNLGIEARKSSSGNPLTKPDPCGQGAVIKLEEYLTNFSRGETGCPTVCKLMVFEIECFHTSRLD